MPITSIADMKKNDTTQWNEQQQGWIPLWNEIQNNEKNFFNLITFNVPIRAEGHAYWDFRLKNPNKPSKMGLKVRATTVNKNVSIYFADREPQREKDRREFIGKLKDAGFIQNQAGTKWSREELSLEFDGRLDRQISFAIYYPGNMNDTVRAKWQVK